MTSPHTLRPKVMATDPKKLEGKTENAAPREYFWDSITLYVVGIIIGLSAIDLITEFIRGSAIACLPGELKTKAFIDSYCASSIPVSQYFPTFISVHALLIAIPHYLWANHYGGNFEFFFTQVKLMDRIENDKTGYYSKNNFAILEQLTKAFCSYKTNWMFRLYVLKLLLQLFITVVGLFAAVYFFTNFEDVFLCPRNFQNTTDQLSDSLWPFKMQVTCTYKTMRLFAMIRIADIALLFFLILCFMWSLLWCANSHPRELGTNKVAAFSFQSNISPGYYLHNSSFGYGRPTSRFLNILLASIPSFGDEPQVNTDLDFLILKLFRTDSGLGYVFREMQVLRQINDLNDDDQRRVNLHKLQQKAIYMKHGGEYLIV